MNVQVMSRKDVRDLAVVGKDLEIIDWVLYDSLLANHSAVATSFRFFQQAFGNAGITKESTNMEIPGQLPANYRFVCQKILLSTREEDATKDMLVSSVKDSYKLLHRGRVSFAIGSRNYLEVPTADLIGGVLIGFAALTSATTEIAYAAPRTVINGELEYSPVIPSTFSFGVLLEYDTVPAITSDKKIVCQLVGKLIRPRQG